MVTAAMKRAELRAHMFRALAHPLRMLMLEKLETRSWCVCKLAEELGVDKSVASKHLSILKEAGLVSDERRGTIVEYSLSAPCVLRLAACAEGAVLRNRTRRLGLSAPA